MGQTIEAHAKAEQRMKTVFGHLKQEHLGDFGVGNGGYASRRRDDQVNDGRIEGHSLMAKAYLCFIGGG